MTEETTYTHEQNPISDKELLALQRSNAFNLYVDSECALSGIPLLPPQPVKPITTVYMSGQARPGAATVRHDKAVDDQDRTLWGTDHARYEEILAQRLPVENTVRALILGAKQRHHEKEQRTEILQRYLVLTRGDVTKAADFFIAASVGTTDRASLLDELAGLNATGPPW